MNTLAIIWKAVTGFINPFGDGIAANITDYALGKLNAALIGLSAGKKAKIQAALNLATRVLALLKAVAWLIPTKWQKAFDSTIAAVGMVTITLDDLNVTAQELADCRQGFANALLYWRSGDDETCVE